MRIDQCFRFFSWLFLGKFLKKLSKNVFTEALDNSDDKMLNIYHIFEVYYYKRRKYFLIVNLYVIHYYCHHGHRVEIRLE